VDANRRSELLRATVAIAMRDRLLAAVRQEAGGMRTYRFVEPWGTVVTTAYGRP
jgi:hypothetical protein